MAKQKERLRFTDDNNWNLKIRCSVGLTIEPYGFRQGQRIAMLTISDQAEEMTLKQIVLEIYKLKTNCITISGETIYIMELVAFLRKFINYCKIHINMIGNCNGNPIRLDKVLCSYDGYYDGMNDDDTIVLFVNDDSELDARQKEAESIRSNYKFAGKIFIVFQNEISTESYQSLLDTSVHYKTKYQRMI